MATKKVTYEYKEKTSGRIINNMNIVADDENGIIESIGNGAYRFIDKDNLEKEPVAANYGYDEKEMPSIPEKPNVSPYNGTKPGNATKELGEYYDYLFGIEKISLKAARPNDTAGFISQEIEIGPCDYIELSTDVPEGTAGVEFSIIDGTKEIPILPAEMQTQNMERLFYGLPIRFKADASKDFTIYQNKNKTSLTQEDIPSLNFDGEIYDISYTPVSSSHRYTPDNQKIRVKVIERQQDDTPPVSISSIVILKHGGSK